MPAIKKKYTPPVLSISAQLRNMPAKSALFFKDAKPKSIWCLVVRVKKSYPIRQYRTETNNDGIMVWRDK